MYSSFLKGEYSKIDIKNFFKKFEKKTIQPQKTFIGIEKFEFRQIRGILEKSRFLDCLKNS